MEILLISEKNFEPKFQQYLRERTYGEGLFGGWMGDGGRAGLVAVAHFALAAVAFLQGGGQQRRAVDHDV